ncbi:galactitol-1-phosphate 5-dehydrogenase [Gracilinema caldarium]|uniref:L-iditol 2-dehydrogenase n=1 Tax=Gracilinema caldarium (strain ATCC 51460 / DSM 7334 / H1) TaxID=744872 RepID=F8F3A6_GRAC1|nr:galactitol-1-phosphate 5-dehydrogenase [Gracilinema caldarium]AEJ20943.1 L-iditol 2-dehydrogenase [Gracilinema caldarium DSM 7334]
MKALLLDNVKHFSYTDVPEPSITEPDHVLIQIKAASICGSDVHGIDGSTGRRIPPIIMGHEASGIIKATGPAVHHFSPGDRVTFDSTIYCGNCFYCRRGEVNLCDDRRVIGVSCKEYKQDGAFAEYLVVPERVLYALPDEVDFIHGALTEPVAVVAHALRLARLSPGDSVLIVGTGLIGLLLLQLVRLHTSGQIIAVDIDEKRLKLAEKLGADAAILVGPDVSYQIQSLTHGRGVDQAFEVVGSEKTVTTAIEGLRKGGHLTLVGNVSPSINLPLQAVVTRQLDLQGSCAISGEYEFALQLMASQKINVDSIISAVAPLKDGALWFERLYNREPGLLKVVLEL